MKKRILAMLLSAVMLLSLLPASAFAVGEWGGTGVAAVESRDNMLYALGNNLVLRDGGSGLTQVYYADDSGAVLGSPIDLGALGFAGSADGADLSAATLWATFDGAYGGDSSAFQNLDVVLTVEGGTLSAINTGLRGSSEARSITVRMSGGTLTSTGTAITANTVYLSGGAVAGNVTAEAVYLSGSPSVGSDTTGIAVGQGQQVYLIGALSGADIHLVPAAELADGTVLAEASSGYTITENDLTQLHLAGSYAAGKELYLEDNQVKIRTAQPEPQYVAYIDSVGYESLAAAVEEAQPGQTVTMAKDDTATQDITIDKNLTIELSGFRLSDTDISVTAGTVDIGDSQGTGAIHGSVTVGGSATVTLRGLNLESGSTALLVQGGTLTVKGGTYSAPGVLSVEAGKAVVESGTFTGTNYAVSYTGAAYTPGDITVYEGSFSATNGSAFQAPDYDGTAAQAAALFLESGSYIADEENFDPKDVTVVRGIYAAKTGGAYGSTDEQNPAEILLLGGRSYAMTPDIQGGDGSAITYVWTRNGERVGTGSSYRISGFEKKNIGLYTVTATQGNRSVTLYWQVGVDSENEQIVAVNGEMAYNNLTTAMEAAESGDTIRLTKDVSTSGNISSQSGKDVTLELDGHRLRVSTIQIRSQVTISDRVGTGRLEASLNVTGSGAALTMNNVTMSVNETVGFAIDDGGSLTINGGSYENDSGVLILGRAIRRIIINGGVFTAKDNVILLAPINQNDITIYNGKFSTSSRTAAISFGNSSVTTAAKVRELLLEGGSDSYIVDEENFDPENFTIANGIYAAPGSGSTDKGRPVQLTPADGETVTLTAHIAGGDGSAITYTWYKNGREISGETGSALTISDFGPADDGLYTVTATQGERSVTLYWQIQGCVEEKTVVAYIGSAGYETLAAAVAAARPGDTVTMAADDPTVQTVTINKDLTLELDGYDLPDTRIMAEGGAYVTLNDRLGTGEIGKLASVEDNTLSIYDATVVINNLRVYGYKSDEYTGSVTTEWGESAIYLYEAGTLTINGGSYFGRGSLGDGIRVREGATLTINGGLFQALGDGVAVSYRYDGPQNLTIYEGSFYAAEAPSAFYTPKTGHVTDVPTLEDCFLQEEIGNYFVSTQNPASLTIRSGIYVLDGLVGEKYGSADKKAPAEVYLTEGEDFTMEPEIQGITIGAITYTWYKNGEVIDGETGPALTIDAYDPTVDKGDYYLKATQGTRTVRVYWQVGTAYEVYVGGTQVTESNAANILGDGTAAYNAETKTLTLNGLNLTNQGVQSSVQGDTIFASILSRDDLHIVLSEGSVNTITTTANVANAMVFGVAGVKEDGTATAVTLSGTGKLTLDLGLSQRTTQAMGIFAGNASVENAELEATLSGSEYTIGVGAASLELRDASVTLSGAEFGMAITGGLTVDGSSSLRASGNLAAIQTVNGPISVSADLGIWGSTAPNDYVNLTRARVSVDETKIMVGAALATTVEIRENDAVPYIDENGADKTLTGAYTVIEGDTTTWEDGWYVADADMLLTGAVTVTGDVKLILKDGANLTVQGGISVPEGSTFTVYGQQNGTGNLTSIGTNGNAGIGGSKADVNFGTIILAAKGKIVAAGDTRAAGIGGGGLINNGAAVNGTIHIYRGTIEATGGSWAAGIGGGADSITNCTILIDGGTIKAMGGENNTGIGGTDGSKEIIINGGNITAYGSGYGAGIGGSYNASGGTITITGGVIDAGSIGGGNAAGGGSGGTIEISGGVVTAERIGAGGNNKEGTFSTGQNGNAVIFAGAITDHDDTSAWNGIIFEDGDGKIYGSSYTVDENLTIPADNTLTIEDGKTLTVAGGVSFENNGTIEVSNGGTYMGSQPTGNKVTYQIDWDTDGDGDVDDTAFVAYGKTPTHEDGEKAGTAEFIYEFTGWTPDVATVTGTATYTATFTERARSYKVTVPTDEGYTVKYSGSTTVPYDSEFSFTVEIARGYYKTSGFAVKANGEPLTAGADGGYTVRVLANTQITVEGVAREAALAAPTVDTHGYESEWTADDVILTLSATAGSGIACYEYSTDGGDSWTKLTGNRLTVSESNFATDYIFRAVSNVGNVSPESEPVTVKIDRTAPDGDIQFEENSVKKFINEITFGLFFNKNIDVTITATDALGEVETIEYYKSDKVLTEADVQAITEWVETDGSFSVTAEDRARFIYYVKITDKAGNAACFGSDGATFDLTAPVISGVQDGETYYVSQVVTVLDENLDAVTLNGEAAGSPVTLTGDTDAAYTVVARDKVGNETAVTVTMKPISTLAEPIEGLTPENVTSADEETVETVKEQVESIDTEDATEQEKEELQEILDKCNELLKKIQEVAEVLEDLENRFEELDVDHVTPDDKETLEKLKEDIGQALTDYAGNLTEEEKARLEELLRQVEDALELLQRVQEAEDAIAALPETVEPDDLDTVEEIEAAKDQYGALSEQEQALVSQAAAEKLQRLLAEMVDYAVIKGAGGRWQKGTKTGLSFTANGAYAKFTGIEVDGKAVDEANYTAKSGSTILTLKPEYLETLSVGKHTLTFLYADGEAGCRFEILKAAEKPATGTNKPTTGDQSALLLWAALLLLSGAALLAVSRKKRRASR